MDARAAIEQAKARGDRAFFERALDESRGVKALLQTLEQLGQLLSVRPVRRARHGWARRTAARTLLLPDREGTCLLRVSAEGDYGG
jgi:hypothetical protein